MHRSWIVAGLLLVAAPAVAQEQPESEALLSQATLNAIANQLSGAQALHNVMEMCPYERNRPAEEYQGTYREAKYAEAKAKEYGFSDVHIERFPLGSKQWAGEMAELWVTEPGTPQLITSFRDVTATLATGSHSADVTADLVYVGRGDSADDYKDKDVKGKIVLCSGPVGAAHNLAVRQFGAEGVVSFFNATGKPIDRPDQIGWSGIGGGGAAAQPARRRRRRRWASSCHCGWASTCCHVLEKHQHVKVHAMVKATEYDTPMQVVVATIPGDGSTNEEFHFTAHLFEGIAKQGANDNCGGPATQLEAGRAWIALINAGMLPKPKRTVRFLWVPEISGTRAYLKAHTDLAAARRRLRIDRHGRREPEHQPQLAAPRPDDVPRSRACLNDVSRQFFEYVGDTNREKLHNRRIAYAFSNPIVDPAGTHDPFWYHIEKFYGSSDHQVHLDWDPRIPAVQFGNWPDAVYHSSDDSPANQDPTQMKRSAFLMVTIGSTIADAGPADAVAISQVALGYAQQRLAADLGSALVSISTSTADTLNQNYKEALNVVTQAYVRERAEVRSATTLAGGDKDARRASRRSSRPSASRSRSTLRA